MWIRHSISACVLAVLLGACASAPKEKPDTAATLDQSGAGGAGSSAEAAASYEKAIAADSNFAPAYRNLGVVSDLYLGDPERALLALERYKELTGEDRPVTSWIAELRQRTGKPAVKPPGPAPAATPEA